MNPSCEPYAPDELRFPSQQLELVVFDPSDRCVPEAKSKAKAQEAEDDAEQHHLPAVAVGRCNKKLVEQKRPAGYIDQDMLLGDRRR